MRWLMIGTLCVLMLGALLTAGCDLTNDKDEQATRTERLCEDALARRRAAEQALAVSPSSSTSAELRLHFQAQDRATAQRSTAANDINRYCTP